MTTNLINGKRYIGQHSSKQIDKWYIGSGSILKKAVKKYGKENFTVEILEYATSKDELDELEIKYIQQFNAANDPSFYNIGTGGKSGNAVPRFGSDNPMFGKKGILNPKFGKPVSEATRRLQSEVAKSQYKNGRIPVNQGKHLSEETKQKISQSHKGKGLGKDNPNYGNNWTDEMKQRMSEMKKQSRQSAGINNGRAKPVRCVETGIVYECASYASREYHCCRHWIIACCNKERELAGNVHWEYASKADTVPSSDNSEKV